MVLLFREVSLICTRLVIHQCFQAINREREMTGRENNKNNNILIIYWYFIMIILKLSKGGIGKQKVRDTCWGSGRVELGKEEKRVCSETLSFTHLGNLLPPLAHAPRVTRQRRYPFSFFHSQTHHHRSSIIDHRHHHLQSLLSGTLSQHHTT